LKKPKLNACTRLTLTGLCIFLEPLKQHDSETYCSFTEIKYQIDEITPDNNTEKK
jgi:hypothetical protein